MKTTFKSLAILMMAAAGFAACDDDSSDNSGKKEYALSVKFNIQAADSTFQDQVPSIQEKAATSAGFLGQDYLYITARDSADAAPQIKAMADKMDKVLDESKIQLQGHIDIYAMPKELLADEAGRHTWACWHETTLLSPDNAEKIK